MFQTCEKHVVDARERLEKEEKGQKLNTAYYNIVDEWLHADLPDFEKSDRRLGLEALGLIGAASETTAWTRARITFYIDHARSLMRKRRAELVEASTYAAGADLPLASFTQGDFLQADLSDATILWIVGTCWSEATRRALSKRIQTLNPPPIVVSVSGPLPLLLA